MLRYLPLLAVLALGVPAHAEECIPTTSRPEITVSSFYVDNDDCGLHVNPNSWFLIDGECLFSIWTYEESNGIEGLQRWDEMHDDTCGGMIEGDTLAFY